MTDEELKEFIDSRISPLIRRIAACEAALSREITQAPTTDDELLVFDCTGKINRWALTKQFAGEIEEAFPDVDVLAESKKARLWIVANRKRRKTARGMPQFLRGWIERGVNSGRYAKRGEPHRSSPSPESVFVMRTTLTPEEDAKFFGCNDEDEGTA